MTTIDYEAEHRIAYSNEQELRADALSIIRAMESRADSIERSAATTETPDVRRAMEGRAFTYRESAGLVHSIVHLLDHHRTQRMRRKGIPIDLP